ncbi:MAG: ATP-dependent RecD-like DNA helicase [Chloroflexi bacterium]|nr:ATP-dependent RecD-like DNA helicase [Chloroflexota bacterium]
MSEAGGTEPPGVELRGAVERITYQNADTGYTVARIDVGRGRIVTVVGTLPGINPGESVLARGHWAHHPEHGRQFLAHDYRLVLPATVEGIRKYLGSGLVKGVGPVTANRIVEHFGTEALDVIDEDPGRLIEVPGVGPKRVDLIGKAWVEQRAIKEVMVLLQGLGVHTGLAVRIYKQYGDAAVGVVKNEPYRLVRDVWGVGFKTADKIAQGQGLPADSIERAEAGLLHTLSEAADSDGHVFLPKTRLVEQAVELLGLTPERVATALEQLVQSGDAIHDRETVRAPTARHGGRAVREARAELDDWGGEPDRAGPPTDAESAIYLVPFYRAESNAAVRLRRLLETDVDRLGAFGPLHTFNWPAAFGWVEERVRLRLSEEQRAAVRLALTSRVAVLTGGPGTGKSSTVRTVVALARAKGARVLLAAPTGRAAKRLEELTGAEARTLHRLLGLRPGARSQADEQNPLEADLLVVDEVSMLDTILFNALLRAVAAGTHLLLVGDADQLPAVGAGNVLRDLLDSDAVPAVRLSQIFRQEEGSAIITNAHRINAGEVPRWGTGIRDFFFFPADEPERAADLVVELIQTRIPRRFGIAPAEIQALVPMHRGAAGVGTLNQRLQEALNPADPRKPEARIGGRALRVGDRLLAHRNNYTLEVFNGDLGRLEAVDHVDHRLDVRMDDGRLVSFEFSQADELSLSYAISVHKSQGSEFRAVVVPVLTSHYVMLARNLLYTAVTRAKELVVLVGQPRAVAIAVRNDRVAQRFTLLAERLRGA